MKQIKESRIKMKKDALIGYEYAYYFKNENWIEYYHYLDKRFYRVDKNKKPKLFEAVKNNGVKFKTVDDDNGDAMHGVFWSPHGIDFEPLEYMEADRGHTMLYYKEPQKDWQVL